jgi:FeS assembly SUF system protein
MSGGVEMGLDREKIKQELIAMLRGVYDPEIPVNIFELGLVYEVEVEEGGAVRIVMTLTSPMCPVAEILPVEIETRAREIEGVREVRIKLVWDPPWGPEMMSEAARLELGM